MPEGWTLARVLCAVVALIALSLDVSPAAAAQWVPGFYGPAGGWHPGHWVGGYGGPPPEQVGPPPGWVRGRIWVQGHYGREGIWHPGHWAPA